MVSFASDARGSNLAKYSSRGMPQVLSAIWSPEMILRKTARASQSVLEIEKSPRPLKTISPRFRPPQARKNWFGL